MIYDIQNALKDMLDAEAVPSGRLSSLKSVVVGELEQFAADNYPVIVIIYDNMQTSGNIQQVEIELNYRLILFVIQPTKAASDEAIQNLIWEDGSPAKGIAPLFLARQALQVNGQCYQIETGEIKQHDPAGTNASAAMTIPLIVKTIRTIT